MMTAIRECTREEVEEMASAILACFPGSPEEIDLAYVEAEIDWYESDTGTPAGVSSSELYTVIRVMRGDFAD